MHSANCKVWWRRNNGLGLFFIVPVKGNLNPTAYKMLALRHKHAHGKLFYMKTPAALQFLTQGGGLATTTSYKDTERAHCTISKLPVLSLVFASFTFGFWTTVEILCLVMENIFHSGP
jgi:hypothetical protein